MIDENKDKVNKDYLGHRKRLKERFIKDAGKSMPDYEILELLLMYAQPRKDVKPLAKQLLERYKTLSNILTTSPIDLQKVSGVGEHLSTLLLLVHTCSQKISWEKLEEGNKFNINHKTEVVEFCRSLIGYKGHECLLLLYLNVHGEFIAHSIEQVGSLDYVNISPRQIVESALNYNAGQIIIAHNHPSGDVSPSTADIQATKKLQEALGVVDIKLIDHIVVSPNNYFSMEARMHFLR